MLQCCESHGVHLQRRELVLKKDVKIDTEETTIRGQIKMNSDTKSSSEKSHDIMTANHDTDPDPDTEPAILINLSDTFALPRQGSSSSSESGRRESSQRQSMGWYGAFMARGGSSGSEGEE